MRHYHMSEEKFLIFKKNMKYFSILEKGDNRKCGAEFYQKRV